MPVSEELDLDLGPALRAIREELDSAFEASVSSFQSSLNDAISSVSFRPVTDEATESATSAGTALQDSLSGAVESFDAGPISTSLSAAGDEASQALGSSLAESADSFSAQPIADEIAAVDATVPIDADTTALGAQITGEIAAIDPPPIEVSVDTTDGLEPLRELQAQLDDIGTSAQGLKDELATLGDGSEGATVGVDQLTSSTDRYGKVAETATISTGVFTKGGQNLGKEAVELAGRLGTVGVVTAGVVTAVGALGLGASKAIDIQDRFNTTFGQSAHAIEAINIGGLTGDLSELAIKGGASDDALREVAISVGLLGERSGVAQGSVAQTAEQILALSFALSGANPALGTAEEVAGRLPNVLAKGGKAAAQFGLDLNAADISAKALSMTGKTAKEDLTQFEKAAAGAALATDQLGNSFGDKFLQGASSAQGRLRSVKTDLGELFEGLGKPLAEPVVATLESLLSVLKTVFQVLEDTHAIDAIAIAFKGLALGINAVLLAVNAAEPAFAAFHALLPGGEGPLEAYRRKLGEVKEPMDRLIASSDEIIGIQSDVAGSTSTATIAVEDHAVAVAGLSDELTAGNPAMEAEAVLLRSILEPATQAALGINAVQAAHIALVATNPALIDTLADAGQKVAQYTAEVVGSVPGISEALNKVSEDHKVSFREIRDALNEQIDNETKFFDHIQEIVNHGGASIAQRILEMGPERGAAAATAVAQASDIEIQRLNQKTLDIQGLQQQHGQQEADVYTQAMAQEISARTGIPISAAIEMVKTAAGQATVAAGATAPAAGSQFTLSSASGITSQTDKTNTAARGVAREASGSFTDEGQNKGPSAGGSFTRALASGMLGAGALSAVASAAATVARKAASWLVEHLHGSPEWVTEHYGNDLVSALGKGLVDEIPSLATPARKVGAALSGALSSSMSFAVSDFPAFRLPNLVANQPAGVGGFGGPSLTFAPVNHVVVNAGPGADVSSIRAAVDSVVTERMAEAFDALSQMGLSGVRK